MAEQLKNQEEIVKQMTDEIESKGKDLKEKESLIESLQQKLKEKGNECGICFEAFSEDTRAMCFFPCGHARTCQGCYQRLPNPKMCPLCRIKITNATVLFY